MGEFFDMGGYAAYIWPAYAASILGVAGLVWAIRRRAAAIRRKLEALERRQTEPDSGQP